MDEKTKHCWECNKSKENYEIMMVYKTEYNRRNSSIFWNVAWSEAGVVAEGPHCNGFVAEIQKHKHNKETPTAI